MKRLFLAITTLILLLFASCNRNKGMFILHGTVQDGTDSILVVGLDERFQQSDTIFCRDGKFTWKFSPDTVTTLILILPDGRRHPVFAEKDVESFITIPADTALFSVTGGYYNEEYQSFYISSIGDSTLKQSAERIDSFITRDPFSEVTPYLIYDRMVLRHHADERSIQSLVRRMSGNMQDAPYIVSLKNEFLKDMPGNIYMDNLSVRDTMGYYHEFKQIGGSFNHVLVLLWASWMEETVGLRDTLQYLFEKYQDRYLFVTDVSIDVNFDLWKQAVESDTLNWMSYNDPYGWESKLIRSTNVQTIPVYLLFSTTKRLLYRTTSIREMEIELDRTLSTSRLKDDAVPLNRDNRLQRR